MCTKIFKSAWWRRYGSMGDVCGHKERGPQKAWAEILGIYHTNDEILTIPNYQGNINMRAQIMGKPDSAHQISAFWDVWKMVCVG